MKDVLLKYKEVISVLPSKDEGTSTVVAMVVAPACTTTGMCVVWEADGQVSGNLMETV
jgi:hypothetical protein